MADDAHDVIVVGSGAGGGMSALVLARAGVKVLMLEAGRDYDPVAETPMFNLPREAPLRGSNTPDKQFGYYDGTVDGGWEIEGEPYGTVEGEPGFRWFRTRMLGGRTNHWARHCPRFGPLDFKGRTRDGLGADWPITYEDLQPFYDRTEALIGVYGANSGLFNHPDSPPGVLQPPPRPRVTELAVKAACDRLGIPCVPAHRAVLTRPLDDRMACFYATRCVRGCSIGAAFQTTTSLLPMAKATGNLTIRTNAMVRKVEVGRDGLATGVVYVDKVTRREVRAKARAVVLAASAMETSRLLLNSRSGGFRDGAANGSGTVGRYITDSVGLGVQAYIPALDDRPAYNEDGAQGLHMYIPFWLYEAQARGELNFARGYHFEFGGQRGMPDMGVGGLGERVGGYGVELKRGVRRRYGSNISFGMRGEMIPNEQTYCEIDPDLKDKWGIPALRFHWKWTDQEYDQAAHAMKSAAEIVQALGGRVLNPDRTPQQALDQPGEVIHEVGGARMGARASDSVTDAFGRCWEIDNLYITDGAVFASNPHKNPTLTILALAMRNGEHLAARLRRAEV